MLRRDRVDRQSEFLAGIETHLFETAEIGHVLESIIRHKQELIAYGQAAAGPGLPA